MHSQTMDHLMNRFKSMMDIKFAVINSWVMFEDSNGGNDNLMSVGGQPNVWVVSMPEKQ